jgi:class 3 adenylate cyclase/CHASE2 domain-containing sensor protein
MAVKPRSALIFAGIAAGAAAFVTVAFHEISNLSRMELFTDDVRTVASTFARREPQDPRIVIVAVTEDTLAQFPYRSPVDRAFLANLLRVLQERGASVIGLDVLFDQPTEPEKDADLKATIAGLKTPLFISYTNNPAFVDQAQLDYLNEFVPRRLRARAEIGTDPVDGVTRWIDFGKAQADGTFLPGLATAVAGRAGADVPTHPVAPEHLVWHGQPDGDTDPFRIFPAHAVPVLPAAWFKDKIVLIGEMVTLNDRHPTPFDIVNRSDMAGIEIHANAVSQLVAGRHAWRLGRPGEIALVLLLTGLGALYGMVNRRLVRHVTLGLATLVVLWAAGFGLFHVAGLTIPLVEPSGGLLLAMWGADAVTGREARRKREFIQSAFSLYVSPHYVRQLADNPGLLKLGGEMREMTLMFCDIRGFTTLSESMNAQDLTRFLNRFLTPMTDAVQATGGTVDKYMGDAIMAFWNAPVDDPAHAERACRAALAMRAELVRLNQTWREDSAATGQPHHEVKIGIGLNTGDCCVGNLGADQKFNYSVIGDDVNLCSRLEGQTKAYGVDIVIGEKTAAEAPTFALLELDLIRVKGKIRPVHIYALVGDERMAENPAFTALAATHDAMLAAYRGRNWAEARRQIETARANAPELMQKFYVLYENRISAFETEPPSVDWDGVYVALEK